MAWQKRDVWFRPLYSCLGKFPFNMFSRPFYSHTWKTLQLTWKRMAARTLKYLLHYWTCQYLLQLNAEFIFIQQTFRGQKISQQVSGTQLRYNIDFLFLWMHQKNQEHCLFLKFLKMQGVFCYILAETWMNTNSKLLILLCFIGFLRYFYVAKFLPSLSSKVKSHNLWSFYTEQHLRHKHEATEMICTVTYRCERNTTVKHSYTEPRYIEHMKTKFRNIVPICVY